MRGAVVERRARHGVEHAHQAMHRIVGELRIGGVALHAVHDELAGEAAAPADLDHVAQALRIGRLADQTGIERFAFASSASRAP